MSNSYYHAKSAAHKWGGEPEDYLPIEEFIDSGKQAHGDVRHRALYHHTLGVFLCQQMFGVTLVIEKRNGTGTVEIPVREIAERHIIEDLGYIPSPTDWLKCMNMQPWMGGRRNRYVGREEMLTTTIKEGQK